MGQTERPPSYRQRAQSVRRAVHAKFFRPEDNSYVNGFAGLSVHRAVGRPAAGELGPPSGNAWKTKSSSRRRGHIHAGITGGYFVIKDLVESGRDDLILAMATKDDYPSWGDMLRQGATTFWESWEGDNSLLHSSYLHLGLWFVEGLGGIRPDPRARRIPDLRHSAGRSRETPQAGLEWVVASYESLYGPIASRWSHPGQKASDVGHRAAQHHRHAAAAGQGRRLDPRVRPPLGPVARREVRRHGRAAAPSCSFPREPTASSLTSRVGQARVSERRPTGRRGRGEEEKRKRGEEEQEGLPRSTSSGGATALATWSAVGRVRPIAEKLQTVLHLFGRLGNEEGEEQAAHLLAHAVALLPAYHDARMISSAR